MTDTSIIVPTKEQQMERAIYEIEIVLLHRASSVQQVVQILAGVFRQVIEAEDKDIALKFFNDLMPGLYEYDVGGS